MPKYSSFKNQQLLTENFRRFLHEGKDEDFAKAFSAKVAAQKGSSRGKHSEKRGEGFPLSNTDPEKEDPDYFMKQYDKAVEDLPGYADKESWMSRIGLEEDSSDLVGDLEDDMVKEIADDEEGLDEIIEAALLDIKRRRKSARRKQNK